MGLNLDLLRDARTRSGLTLAQMGERLGVAASQIQRIEKGKRRITLDVLERYCDILDLDIIDVIRGEIRVPIIGVIDGGSNVLPLTPNTDYTTRAPNIVPRPERLSAIRWEAGGQFSPMFGHLLFFYGDVEGVPDNAWNHRCLIRRPDGTQRTGWPVRKEGQTHIDDVVAGRAEFNVDISWASPILAVMPPDGVYA